MASLVDRAEKVLDLGCAQMPNPYLSNEHVIGLDMVDSEMPENYSEFVIGNASELPKPFDNGKFDGIVAGELIEHLERPVDFLRRCRETLRPGGDLILSTPNPNSPWERLLTITLSRRWMYSSEHVCLYPQRWLIRLLERAGFEDVRLYSGGIQSPWGLVPFPRAWCYQTIGQARRPQ